MIRKFSLLISCSLALMASEPSAFGAGDINSASPYGLTPTEQHIYENKKLLATQQNRLENLNSETKSTNTRLEDLQADIDGLKAIVDGEGQKGNARTLEMNKLKDEMEKNSLAVQTFEKKISEMEKVVQANNNSIEEIKNIVKELSLIVAKLEDGGASSKEKDDAKAKPAIKKDKSEEVEVDFKNKAPLDIYNDAEEAFEKGDYAKSKKMYEKLVELKYKPAKSTYMLAESEYNQKNYAKALDFYKKSVSIYDKAEYMPDLLYHSGVSCMNLKDNKNAITFLSTVVEGYPDYQDIEKVKKLLKSLKAK